MSDIGWGCGVWCVWWVEGSLWTSAAFRDGTFGSKNLFQSKCCSAATGILTLLRRFCGRKLEAAGNSVRLHPLALMHSRTWPLCTPLLCCSILDELQFVRLWSKTAVSHFQSCASPETLQSRFCNGGDEISEAQTRHRNMFFFPLHLPLVPPTQHKSTHPKMRGRKKINEQSRRPDFQRDVSAQ